MALCSSVVLAFVFVVYLQAQTGAEALSGRLLRIMTLMALLGFRLLDMA